LPPLEVADFGCGSGVLSVAIARWAKRVIAIDQSRAALNRARQRAAREGLENIRFVQQDLHQLSLPTGAIDLVVISQSLHHVREPEAVLREAARILRASGRIIALELMPHQESWVLDRLGHQHLGFDPKRLESSLKEAGFLKVTRQVPERQGASPFRVFLVSGEKKR
jgi:ArsR family transcriptional regulator